MSEKNYTLQRSQGFLDHFVLKKRLEMLKIFFTAFPESSFNQVMDVGVTAETSAISAHFFEENIQNKKKIIALSNQNAKFLETIYPGLLFKLGDAKNLPFENNSIDVIFSSAVIEHVGSFEEQKKMIAECFRVCKKGMFITTPNRWYPIDPHTVLPFLHWLPKPIHRAILKKIGLSFYSLEENLNLLDKKSIVTLCHELHINRFFIEEIKTWGMTSNFMLIIKKD